MSIGFFIVGGIIFAVYLFLMFWNIVYSNKKQREENYPSIPAKVSKNKAVRMFDEHLTKL